MIFTVNCDVIICFNWLIALNIQYIHLLADLNNNFSTNWDIFLKQEFWKAKLQSVWNVKIKQKFLLCVRSILILLWLDINLTFIFTHFQAVTVSKKEGKKILLKLVATKSRKTQSLSHTFVMMKKKDDGLSDPNEHFWTNTTRKSHKVDFVVNCQLSNFS